MTIYTRLSGVLALFVSGAVLGAPAGHANPAPAPAAAPVPGVLKATLIGKNEVPGPGDEDGTGAATVTINAGTSQLCYTVSVQKVDGITMAHIHHAPMGSMGNVVLPFAPPTSGSSQGCAQIKPELAADIIAHPSDYYVNVHSEAHPAGAVRGQLGQ